MTLSGPHQWHLCRSVASSEQKPSPSIHILRTVEPLRWKCAKLFVRWRKAHCEWLRAGFAVTLLLGFSLPALASLGGNINSVESDRAHMNASTKVTSHSTYEVHQMQAPGGTVVNEYAAPDGTVFAVAWHGQFPPPLQQILGSYFQQYTAAVQARPKMYGHRPLNIQQPGLVVQTGGHMRAHFGRAFIPNLLPQGITASQLQ